MKKALSILLSIIIMLTPVLYANLFAYAEQSNDSMVKSIDFKPAKSTYIKNDGGWWNTNGDDYYYDYDVCKSFRSIGSTLTINYKDGSIDKYTYKKGYNKDFKEEMYGFYNAKGEPIVSEKFSCSDDQELHHWVKNGKYNYNTICYSGVSCKVPVTIIDNIKVSDISVKQVKCADNSLSKFDISENNYFEYTIRYSNGTVEKTTNLLLNGAGYNSVTGFFGDGKYIFSELLLEFNNNKNLVGTKMKFGFDLEGNRNELLIKDHIKITTKVIKTATSKATGIKKYICSACGAVKSTTTVPLVKSFSLSATNYNFDGKVKTPSVTVKDNKGKVLRKGTDYDVTYSSGRKNVGKYAVKVTLKGNYSGTKTLYFNINPKGTSIVKVTPKSKAFTVSWKKQTNQTTGYQIQYSTYSNFKSVKTITMPKSSYYAKSITGLAGNKRYYVRVRTYKTVKFNGKNYNLYSPWSSAKYTTTKR